MPSPLSLFLVSILPGLLWVSYFYRQDLFEPEPKDLILKVFVGGMFIVLPAGALEVLGRSGLTAARNTGDTLALLFYSFLFIGLIEEGLKFALLWVLVRPTGELDEPVDGIIYGITVGLGFAALENLFYTLALGFEVGLWRAVVTSLAHAVFTGWGGYLLTAQEKRFNQEWSRFLSGFGVAVFLHGLYDFLLFLKTPVFTSASLLLTAVLIYFLIQKINTLVIRSPFREE